MFFTKVKRIDFNTKNRLKSQYKCSERTLWCHALVIIIPLIQITKMSLVHFKHHKPFLQSIEKAIKRT